MSSPNLTEVIRYGERQLPADTGIREQAIRKAAEKGIPYSEMKVVIDNTNWQVVEVLAA